MSRIYQTLGTVAPTPKGDYDASAYYEYLNIVDYQGSSYMAKQSAHGILPTNTNYWLYLGGGVKRVETVLSFDNVAAMKASTLLGNGMIAQTAGYYSVNDGGASLYKISEIQPINEYYETLENSLYAVMVNQDILNPEQFGAKGDGTTDDTTALTNCFNTGKIVNLTNSYLINSSINIYNSITGNGKIIVNDDYITLNITNLDNIEIKNINVDFSRFATHGFKISGCYNITFDNIKLENIGALDVDYENTGIFIYENNQNITIKNSSFIKSYALHMSSFIWVRNNTEQASSHNILIDNCYFEDNQPLEDGDAVKVLGGNWNCYLTVSNCQFHNCQKRAMKFQGRECHSLNNYIYYSVPSMYPIDFQRGYGSSTNDTIFLDYANNTETLTSSGLSYCGVAITQGNVNISGLTIKKSTISTPSTITSSGAIYFNSLPEYDDGNIKNVSITNCDIDGFAYLLRFNENEGITITLANLFMENINYNHIVDTYYALRINDIVITNANIRYINLTGGTRFIVGGGNVSDSFIETNIASSRLYTNANLIKNNTLINHNGTYYASDFKKDKNKFIVYANNNASPNESTSSQWSNLRLVPKGAIVLCKDYIDNGDNTYTIGYISTSDGSGSAAGTFVPIKINV